MTNALLIVIALEVGWAACVLLALLAVARASGEAHRTSHGVLREIADKPAAPVTVTAPPPPPAVHHSIRML